MYGGSGGEARQLLAVLRRRFPQALAIVEAAARRARRAIVPLGARPDLPAAVGRWRADLGRATGRRLTPVPAVGRRARGRFTRNFVVQASAADWALVLLASLRAGDSPRCRRPDAGAPQLVFFQHDEVVVHCPARLAERWSPPRVGTAGRLLFGPTRVAFPLNTAVVGCYADAK